MTLSVAVPVGLVSAVTRFSTLVGIERWFEHGCGGGGGGGVFCNYIRIITPDVAFVLVMRLALL